MIRHQTNRALFSRGHQVSRGHDAGRFQHRIGLGTLVLVALLALLPQASVMAQLGFNVPYGEHDLSDPGTIDTFELHSNPGATKVIYMDFDGHIAPEWDDFGYEL